VDVIEIDGASNRTSMTFATFAAMPNTGPVGGAFKIYIIDEIHALDYRAFPALLKILRSRPRTSNSFSRPPNVQKVPITILFPVASGLTSPASHPSRSLPDYGTSLRRKTWQPTKTRCCSRAPGRPARCGAAQVSARSVAVLRRRFDLPRTGASPAGTASDDRILALADACWPAAAQGPGLLDEGSRRAAAQRIDLSSSCILARLMVLNCVVRRRPPSLCRRFRETLARQGGAWSRYHPGRARYFGTTRGGCAVPNARTLVEMALVRLGRFGPRFAVRWPVDQPPRSSNPPCSAVPSDRTACASSRLPSRKKKKPLSAAADRPPEGDRWI